MNELGLYLRETRLRCNKSIREVAVSSGISHTELFRIEKGERHNPSPKILEAISKTLNISYEELLVKAKYLDYDNFTKFYSINNINQSDESAFLNGLTPFLLKDHWKIEYKGSSSLNGFDLIAEKGGLLWNFYFLKVSKNNRQIHMRIIDQVYGFLARQSFASIDEKISIVVLDEEIFKQFYKQKPINLHLNLSLILLNDLKEIRLIEIANINSNIVLL